MNSEGQKISILLANNMAFEVKGFTGQDLDLTEFKRIVATGIDKDITTDLMRLTVEKERIINEHNAKQ